MHLKKTLIIALGILLTLVACNRNAYIKKLTGTWSLNRYLYAGLDETNQVRDTSMNLYKLTISEDQSFLETWRSLAFMAETQILSDTLKYDSALSVYLIKFDTIHFIDTTIIPHATTGRWDLLNSEADLQLTSDSTNAIRQFEILTLTKSELNMRNGNVEMYLNK